jgi:hypothetical protein
MTRLEQLKYLNLLISLLCLSIVIFYWIKYKNLNTAGIQGIIGDRGIRGNMGNQGNTGLTGINIDRNIGDNIIVSSPKGPPGLQGITGPTGPRGVIGPIGFKGLTGSNGGIGSTGISGLIGPKGQQGPPGNSITKNIQLLTKYNDCIWSIDKQCPNNYLISGVDFGPILKYYCCPTRLWII